MVGDLVISSLPNTGNPNKVQRYTLEWAEALERIAARRPRYIRPGTDPCIGVKSGARKFCAKRHAP